MSRTDHYVGLNKRGLELTKGLRHVEVYEFEGTYYNEFPIFAYYDEYSKEPKLIEFIQEAPWGASGPHWFMALHTVYGDKIPRSLWTEDEIEGML